MFAKLLIANRGEIACRVIRTARRLGIATVAVYSDADCDAAHVLAADEAYRLGPAPARESYLNIDAVIAAAEAAGADAVHPGYGFLSENAAFAEACAGAGVVFVGPPPAAIRAMGSKSAAKRLMGEAGVPLVPGYHGDAQDETRLAEEAARVGFPVLIKASAGGGGKGMRIVESAAGLREAIAGAKREAKSSFGDDQLLLEKYLTRPRHIEVQVFADTHGGCVHLFERDCSVQRRHQKVIEEAPAPGMDPQRRAAMGAAAIAAARAVGYVGAGTVEFIAEGDAFFFMEMNTRLQVEHPVTEMITGQDLVEWQLRVAAGERLPLAQEQLSIRGHAFEARLYAEDPGRDFLPATGRIEHLRLPAAPPHVRVDAGVRAGDAVSIHYDPMIAKLVAWDEDRTAALRRLRAALAEVEIVGPATNRDFLLRVAKHPAFAAGGVDTGFIARHREALLAGAAAAPAAAFVAAALHVVLAEAEASRQGAAASTDPYSPWSLATGWRLNGATYRELAFLDGGRERRVRIDYRRAGFLLAVDGEQGEATAERVGDGIVLSWAGSRRRARIVQNGPALTVFMGEAAHRLARVDPLAAQAEDEVGSGSLTAPMPGKIIDVAARAGEAVRRGQKLVVLEAMKMEHTIASPADGVLDSVNCRVGDIVEEGAVLIAFRQDAGARSGEGDAAAS